MLSLSDSDESIEELIQEGLKARAVSAGKTTRPSKEGIMLVFSSDEDDDEDLLLPTASEQAEDTELKDHVSTHESDVSLLSDNSATGSPEPLSQPTTQRYSYRTHTTADSSSEQDDAEFEQFLSKMKKSSNKGAQLGSDSEPEDRGDYVVEGNSHIDDSDSESSSLDGFIVPDDVSITEESSSSFDGDDSAFYLRTNNLLSDSFKTRPDSAELKRHLGSQREVSVSPGESADESRADNSFLDEEAEQSSRSDTDSDFELPNTGSSRRSVGSQPTPGVRPELCSPDLSPLKLSDEEDNDSNEENKIAGRTSLLDLSSSESDDEESFNKLLQQGLQNRIASGKTPAKTPAKASSGTNCIAGETTSKSIKLTPAKKLKALMESQCVNTSNSNFELPSLSEDEDDDVTIISEPINTPAPRRFTSVNTPKPGRAVHKSIGEMTPADRRAKLLDSLHSNLTRTEPRMHKPELTTINGKTESALVDSFLSSLSTQINQNRKRNTEAARFVSGFKKNKEELVKKLSSLYDKTVFDNKLSEVTITFNKRLLKTAGFCKYMRTKNNQTRRATIELSEKVCDSAERVRDTLIHEMCHAAVWLINETQDGHGKYWQYWVKKAELTHRDLPPIRRCHTYDITTKYIYKCDKCSQQIGRHSKSLDTNKKVCGICRGKFELYTQGNNGLTLTPASSARPPNKFAQFVKENYASVKKSKGLKNQKEVMKELAEAFAKINV